MLLRIFSIEHQPYSSLLLSKEEKHYSRNSFQSKIHVQSQQEEILEKGVKYVQSYQYVFIVNFEHISNLFVVFVL